MHLLTSGYRPLRCIRCRQFNELSLSPEECENHQEIQLCQDGNFTCANFKTKITIDNVTTEEQAQGCLSKDECTAFSERCRVFRAQGAECTFECCDHDLCNDPDVLTCKQCSGTYTVDEILGLNSSLSLNQTYSASQCLNDEEDVLCRNGTCSTFFYQRQLGWDLEVEVALKSCLPYSNSCEELDNFCREINTNNVNGTTESCRVTCCKGRRGCNKASRVTFTPFYAPYLIMLTVFRL